MGLDNKIKTSDDQKPRFWTDGEGGDYEKIYMEGDELLQYLQDNDPIVVGCDFMTDEEYDANVEEAD